MKNRFAKTLMVAALAGAACSCIFQERDYNRHLVDRAGQLLEQYPDSALMMLKVADTSLLNPAYRWDYVLLKTRAKAKTDEDIKPDTAGLFKARDFFTKRRDHEKAALTFFYLGKIYQSQKKLGLAGYNYKNACDWAEKTGNDFLKGLSQLKLSDLLLEEGSYDAALIRARKAYRYFQPDTGRYQYSCYTLNLTASLFLFMSYAGSKPNPDSSPDSAMYYYRAAFETAKLHADTVCQRDVLQNMSVALREAGKYGEAKANARQAMALTASTDSINLAKLYLNLANIYNATGRKDSAARCLNKINDLLNKADDSATAASMYELLAASEKEDGRFQKALEYYRKYTAYMESDYQKQIEKKVSEMEKQCDFELLQARMQQQKQKSRYVTVITLVSTVLAAAVTVLYVNRRRLIAENKALDAEQKYLAISELYRRLNGQVEESQAKRKRLEDTSQALAQQLEMLEERIEQEETEKHGLISQKIQLTGQLEAINRECSLFDQKERELTALLRQTFDIIKELLPLKGMAASENGASDKILLTSVKGLLKKIDTTTFIDYVNRVQPDFADSIRQYRLKELDYRVCCLARFGFSINSIALILGKEVNTVRQARSDIRKALGLKRDENLDRFLSSIA